MAGESIARGDIFWIAPHALRPRGEPVAEGASSGPDHPYVVVQDDVLNRSRIETVVVCALTSNPRRGDEPGNVRLEAGEGGLPRASVAVVSQVCTVDKAALGERLGRLAPARVDAVLTGLDFQQETYFAGRS